MSEEWREVLVVTSDGRYARDRQPMIRFGVHAVAEEAGKRQGGRAGGAARRGMEQFLLPEQSPEEQGREAARLAIAMLHAAEAPAGPMPVVLGPGESGILLHEAVGHGLEADFNRKRTSNYTDQVGQVVASALCTVVDDGTIGNARGSINVDDEGSPGRRNVLIENGILVGYMQDRISARHFRTEPTGNGRRESFRHEPLPRMTNTFMMAGQRRSPRTSSARSSAACTPSASPGGQVNISNGDFVFSLTESYLIEDGKLTAPLKGVNLIGNGPDVLRQVSMVGSDFRAVGGDLDLRQGRPVGAGGHRHADREDQRDHRGRDPDIMSEPQTAPSRRPLPDAEACQRFAEQMLSLAMQAGRRRRRGAGARRLRARGEGAHGRAGAGQGGRQPGPGPAGDQGRPLGRHLHLGLQPGRARAAGPRERRAGRPGRARPHRRACRRAS